MGILGVCEISPLFYRHLLHERVPIVKGNKGCFVSAGFFPSPVLAKSPHPLLSPLFFWRRRVLLGQGVVWVVVVVLLLAIKTIFKKYLWQWFQFFKVFAAGIRIYVYSVFLFCPFLHPRSFGRPIWHCSYPNDPKWPLPIRRPSIGRANKKEKTKIFGKKCAFAISPNSLWKKSETSTAKKAKTRFRRILKRGSDFDIAALLFRDSVPDS